MMTTDEMVVVLQAFQKGEQIEFIQKSLHSPPGWMPVTSPSGEFDFSRFIYRVKLQKPREWWGNVYGGGYKGFHDSLEEANRLAGPTRIECIHVREVLEE